MKVETLPFLAPLTSEEKVKRVPYMYVLHPSAISECNTVIFEVLKHNLLYVFFCSDFVTS